MSSKTLGCGFGALALLSACAGDREPAPPSDPTFYHSMASANVEVDAATAASMISGYRKNNGLGALGLDFEADEDGARAGAGDGVTQQVRA